MRSIPKCRFYIPDGNGYRNCEDLSRDECQVLARKITNRMGDALNGTFTNKPMECEQFTVWEKQSVHG